MAYYRTCSHCGAHLDPGEQCDCMVGKVHYTEYVRADEKAGEAYCQLTLFFEESEKGEEHE